MAEWDDKQLELVRAAAERGVCEAQAIYAQLLLDGVVVPQNQALAFYYFERAATGGNVMAVNMVGRCLDQGWGVSKSPHLAAPWFRRAAELGLDWGMYNFATLLTLGSGVPEDKTTALLWFRKAAEQNHAKSINLIGGFYEDGWVVERDLAIATEHYRRAAEGGDFRGQFNYGRMLALNGETDDAIAWFRKVPQSATPAFLAKMRTFLSKWENAEIRHFACSLPHPHNATR